MAWCCRVMEPTWCSNRWIQSWRVLVDLAKLRTPTLSRIRAARAEKPLLEKPHGKLAYEATHDTTTGNRETHAIISRQHP